MGWFTNAWDNISDAASNAGAQVLANVVNGGAATINFVSSPFSDGDVIEKPDWVKARMDKQNEVLADAIESVVEAKNTVVEATSKAYDWTIETGAPAVGNGAAWVVAATPIGYLARGAEAIGLGDPTGIADKHRRAEDAMIGFGKFVIDDPARAGAVLAQGASNAVTTTIGLVGDLGRNAVGLVGSVPGVAWEYVGRPIANAGYSIGQKKGAPTIFDNIDAFAALKFVNQGDSLSDAMKWTSWMNDNTQFVDRIKDQYLADMRETITDDAGNIIDNPDYMKEIELKEGEEAPSYGQIIDNPNANYERTILYGAQALVEVPAFLVTTAATGGAAGSLWALKWGGKGLQTVNAIKRADLVADAVKITEKATKISGKTTKTAAESVEELAHTSKMTGTKAEAAADVVADAAETAAKKGSATGGTSTANTTTTAETATNTTSSTASTQASNATTATNTGNTAATSSTAATGTGTAETSSKATKLTAKADEIARGERLGTATQDLSNWIKRKFPGTDDARQAMTKDDLMEYLAKDAEKLREAENKLDRLISSGKATQRDILKQTNEVKSAEKALEESRTAVNKLASSEGNKLPQISAQEAKTATKTTEDLSIAGRMKRGYDLGSYKTGNFIDPSRSPIIDTIGVGASFGAGVYADQKNAEAKTKAGETVTKESARAFVEESTNHARELGSDTSWFKKDQPNLRNDFQEIKPQQNQSSTSTPLPGGNIQINQHSGSFNNRANGLVTPIDTPLFEVKVPEEAVEQLKKAIWSQ